VKVVWSLRALHELRAQRRFIARTQPAAANKIAERIMAATSLLETYPRYGRVASWDATDRLRELPIAGTPFIVLYTIDGAAEIILVVRVVHGAQLRGEDE
jgi:plasmid stabilization system protein ParE